MARTWPVVLGVALGVSLLVPASPAAAHNSLTGSDPRDGARLASAPARIELRFLASLDPASTKVTVTGPDNVSAVGGDARFAGSRVTVPFRPGKAGLYIVGYQVASSDGHPVTGEVRFTLTTGTPAESATPGGAPSPTGAAPGVPSSAAPSPTAPSPAAPSPTGPSPTVSVPPTASPTAAVPAARESGSDGRGWLWVLGGALVLAALAGALVLRRRQSPHP
ncbi:copper resistance protein CopC [Micromonospora sp. BQ11]|uniref:copper resistance CopC family protein n=1 Tax=Micromonospora sp. BQ11 TaxID=3452212 RepID=UPI003F8CC70E